MQKASSIGEFKWVRKFERKPYSEMVDYSLSVSESAKRKWVNMKGKAVDISEDGIGIQTDYPLAPGHMVWFNSGIEEVAGFVRWAERIDKGYRVGIELDGKKVRHLDEATDIFIMRLESIEKICSDPDGTPDSILQSLHSAFDDVLNACRDFEHAVKDKEIIHEARIRFRQKTNHILSKSYCINRIRTWPQGYQGDYKTLEGIYRNTPLSEGIGYYLDLLTLNWSLGIAVRNRIEKLENILREELSKKQNASVLNIACGSCREVFELAGDIEKSGARFTCIDLDNDALAFAATRLSYTNISPVSSDQIILRKYNAVRMFDHELNITEFGKQDIIYSVGFFDYLDSGFLSKLFRALYQMLKPGGMLITSFKDAARYRHQEYHWIADWDGFLQRSEKDFKAIFRDAQIPGDTMNEIRDESNIIIFYLIRK